jgi:methionyl-tRNA formyltransferase
MTYLFCGYRDWSIKLFKKLTEKYNDIILLKSPNKLTLKYVKSINPKIIFFPDWSWIVDKNIINNYKCICIHESPLPKFRGGSPLQNQIIRGIKKTKSTAFIMNEGIDKGDIVAQRNLSLNGSIDEIFTRMIENDFKIIKKIISGNFKPIKQKGKPTIFKRRKPEESELDMINISLTYLYNFIRMLDDPYPNAFIKLGNKKIIFKNPKFKNGKILFNGEII